MCISATTEKQTVMCVFNQNNETKEIDPKRFEERTKGFTNGIEITNRRQDNTSRKEKDTRQYFGSI